ncbi:MAG: FHA domain-containing protein [Anaerolineae bacterium]|nr:FHA domain-containing protein [Anaerolineae bacterium]
MAIIMKGIAESTKSENGIARRLPIKGEILITPDEGERITYEPDAGVLYIGRATDREIVLNDPNVSRRHARLEHRAGGWYICDLGSTNGTYLNGAPINPNVPVRWEPSQTVRIGNSTLAWKDDMRTQVITPDRDITMIMEAPVMGQMADPVSSSPVATVPGATEKVFVEVTPTTVQVAPYQSVELTVSITNDTSTVDLFNIECNGLPKEWIRNSPAPLALRPGQSETVKVIVRPPQISAAKPGLYRYHFKASSASGTEITTSAENEYIIGKHEAINLSIMPKSLEASDSLTVYLHNTGNTTIVYQLDIDSKRNAVAFSGEKQHLILQAGAQEAIQEEIVVTRRHLLGLARATPFEVRMDLETGKELRVPGSVTVRPLVAWYWLLLLVITLGGAAWWTYMG